MTHRVGMSQVKLKVRYHALLLREFTVADMISATGLNPESVRTELQRMRQEGLLSSQQHPSPTPERHGRAALYRLTDDPEGRLALSRSIEAFYPLPLTDRPTSRHYHLAKHLLDQALNTKNAHRRQLLDEAASALEMAEQAEGSAEASESIQTYLQFEWARLAYLQEAYEQAEQLFTRLRERCSATHDEALQRLVTEFQVCLEVQRRFAAESQPLASEATVGWYLAQTMVEQGYQTDSPLTSLLLLVLRQLSETANEKVSAAVRKDSADSDVRALLADEPPDQQRHIVGKAITHLPPDQQQVIALKFFIGLSTREIAETLGRTEATIKALQSRAIHRLQHLLVNERMGSAS